MTAQYDQWLEALTRGEEAAVGELWDLFYPRLCRRIASSSRALRWSDKEDIALDALVDVCDLIKRGEFRDLSTIEDLWSLLSTIAIRRTTDRRRYEEAACRGGEVKTFSFQDDWDVPSSGFGTTENETAQLIADILDAVDDDRVATVIKLRMQGEGNQAIAEQIGCSVRKVQYMIQDLAIRFTPATEGERDEAYRPSAAR